MWNLWWTCGHDVTDHVDRREENNTSLKYWIKNGTIQETQQCSVNESDKALTSDKEEDGDDAERTSNVGSYRSWQLCRIKLHLTIDVFAFVINIC